MAAADVITPQNVVERVTSLPLVSSTYDLVTSVYCNTKDTHPYIKSVCEAAEHGVRTITSVALTTASPIMDKLEPQIAIANELACKGLDRIEKTLPILHQPSEQIVSSAKDVVITAKDAVADKVSSAKDTVSDTITSVVERTWEGVEKTKMVVQESVEMTRTAMQEGVEKTKMVVGGGVSTVLESRVGRLVSSGVDTALSTSESLVEQYLPLTQEEELELEDNTINGFDRKKLSYYVRLGSLSMQLRKRAYSRALAKIQEGKERSMGFISELNTTVDMIQYGRKNIGEANQILNNKINSAMAWKSRGSNQPQSHPAEVIESQTLALARSLTQQLQTTCLVLVSGLQGLPNHIQQEALSLSRSATQVYSNFRRANALGELPDSMLAGSKAQLNKMSGSLDNVMDYLVNNTPLNWLVGPFYPRMGPAPVSATNAAPSTSSRSRPTRPQRPVPMQVEMNSLQ